MDSQKVKKIKSWAYHQETQFTKEHSNRVKKKERRELQNIQETAMMGSRKRLHSNSCSKTPSNAVARIHLPVAGTWIWWLVFKDSTCAAQWLGLSATNTEPTLQSCEPQPFKSACPPMGSNYWACVLQLWNPRAQSLCSGTRATTRRSSTHGNKVQPLHAAIRESP